MPFQTQQVLVDKDHACASTQKNASRRIEMPTIFWPGRSWELSGHLLDSGFIDCIQGRYASSWGNQIFFVNQRFVSINGLVQYDHPLVWRESSSSWTFADFDLCSLSTPACLVWAKESIGGSIQLPPIKWVTTNMSLLARYGEVDVGSFPVDDRAFVEDESCVSRVLQCASHQVGDSLDESFMHHLQGMFKSSAGDSIDVRGADVYVNGKHYAYSIEYSNSHWRLGDFTVQVGSGPEIIFWQWVGKIKYSIK